jgi:hypothetical protein
MFQKFSILTPTPILGYGYPLEHFWHGIHTYKPNAIIVDSGSTDPGPYLLGTGIKLCSKASYIRDLTPILDACHQFGIKFFVSSAGGDGSNAHVDELVGFINEISEAKGYSFKVIRGKNESSFCSWHPFIRRSRDRRSRRNTNSAQWSHAAPHPYYTTPILKRRQSSSLKWGWNLT